MTIHNPLLRLPLPFRTNIVNHLPTVIRPALNLVPFKVQKLIVLKLLSAIFKDAIEDGDFDFLEHRWVKISIFDLNLHWLLSFNHRQLEMAPADGTIQPEVVFRATGDDLLLIAGRKEDPDSMFFQRRLLIEGDTELGLELKNLIDAVELDDLPTYVHVLIDNLAQFIQHTREQTK
ncbi:SCP2 domain-containing protein [Thalassotalea aquiviva]|uniref:ubiquinone anaerobic biosynthesis accessory factor UbiT n=1 Tax=Thalassotalea aquiviva TaxID=3242415 RepID=UPI00352B9FE7